MPPLIAAQLGLLLFLLSSSITTYAHAQQQEPHHQQAVGLAVSKAAYRANLQHISSSVLPVKWQLSGVLKWDAYGNGISNLGGTAAELGLPVCILKNGEAAAFRSAATAAGVTSIPPIWRIMPSAAPAGYDTIEAAARKKLGVVELMTPANQAAIMSAAKASGTVIPVHIYLFSHYYRQWGYFFESAQQVQSFVESLDPKLVRVVGLMTHNGGLTKSEALARIDLFNKVVCPTAQSLAANQPITLHFASSIDVGFLVPEGGRSSRMQPPAGLCQGPNITWAARMGRHTYGMAVTKQIQGTTPVLSWHATVSEIRTESGGVTQQRRLAVVDVAPHRYPAPSWWKGVRAFNVKSNPAAAAQPESYIFISGQRYRLAAVPSGSGSQLLVDVTEPLAASSGGRQVGVGDVVCLLCKDRPVDSLGEEVGADGHNVALCLMGQQPDVGLLEVQPQCRWSAGSGP